MPIKLLIERKIVAYLSHPIGASDDMIRRGDNIANAGAWLRLLVRETRWAIICPWLAYTTAIGDELHGPRALMDQVTILERSDIVVQVGGDVSRHMEIEHNHARRNNQPIIDLTAFGDYPHDYDAIATSLRLQAINIAATDQRRVWLPPLDATAIEMLHDAERALLDDPNAVDAAGIIRQIVSAALKIR